MTNDGRKIVSPSSSPDATKTVSRRTILRGVTLAGGAAILASAVTTEAEAKMAQQAAGYVAESKTDKRCDNCQLFKAPASCTLIDGVISPKGYCRFYVKKS